MKILDIKYLQGCIIFQELISKKRCSFISLYETPTDIFGLFSVNLELTLDEMAVT